MMPCESIARGNDCDFAGKRLHNFGLRAAVWGRVSLNTPPRTFGKLMIKTLALAAAIAVSPMLLPTADAGCGGYHSGYRAVPSYGYNAYRPAYHYGAYNAYRPAVGYRGYAAPRVNVGVAPYYGGGFGYRGLGYNNIGIGGLGYGGFGSGYGYGAGRGFGYRGIGIGF